MPHPHESPDRSGRPTDEEVSTFLQLEEEAKSIADSRRECPVPKPGGVVGELLGFKRDGNGQQEQQRRGMPNPSTSSQGKQ